MADNTQTPNRSDSKMEREPGKSDSMSQGSNQTMKHEQAKASVGEGSQPSGQSGQREHGGENREKSAIGGGEDRSQTGEPGRARSELGETEKKGEFSNQR